MDTGATTKKFLDALAFLNTPGARKRFAEDEERIRKVVDRKARKRKHQFGRIDDMRIIK